MDALKNDHEFLLKGDVFTKDVIETWIDYKRTNELNELALRPHPYEFQLFLTNQDEEQIPNVERLASTPGGRTAIDVGVAPLAHDEQQVAHVDDAVAPLGRENVGGAGGYG